MFTIYNNTNEIIPAGALCEPDGGYTDEGELKVKKPTADSKTGLVVNGDFAISPATAGRGHVEHFAILNVDLSGGVPAIGDNLGSVAGSWLAKKGNKGFKCFGGTATNDVWSSVLRVDYPVSPLTTKGDIWGFDTADNRIPVGSNNQVLTADSSQALGVKWSTPVTGITGSGVDNHITRWDGTSAVQNSTGIINDDGSAYLGGVTFTPFVSSGAAFPPGGFLTGDSQNFEFGLSVPVYIGTQKLNLSGGPVSYGVGTFFIVADDGSKSWTIGITPPSATEEPLLYFKSGAGAVGPATIMAQRVSTEGVFEFRTELNPNNLTITTTRQSAYIAHGGLGMQAVMNTDNLAPGSVTFMIANHDPYVVASPPISPPPPIPAYGVVSAGNVLYRGKTGSLDPSDFLKGGIIIAGVPTGSAYVLSDAANTFTNANLFHVATDVVPLTVQGKSGQTADLFDAKNNGGTVLAKIDASGNMTAVSFTGDGSGLTNVVNVAQATRDKITAVAAGMSGYLY